MNNSVRQVVIAAMLVMPAAVMAQTTPVKGESILKHPIGALATKAVDAIAAGRVEDYYALRTKSDQDDWKKSSPAEKKDSGARLKERAPSPAAFADMVRKAGELSIDGDSATLAATTPAGQLRQVFEREGGQWRVSFGPMFMAAESAAAPTIRVQGPELAKHPAIAVVLQYADLVQAGKVDEAMMKLGSAQAQTTWKALPASEKAESSAFRKRILPARADLTKGIASGGLLLVEGDNATLNLIKMEPATAAKSTGSSSTVAIPLKLENGVWKIAQ